MITQRDIDRWWERLDKKNQGSQGMQKVLVIGQPRSGSTWLMNMATYGCNMIPLGDRNIETDRACINYATSNTMAHFSVDAIRDIRNKKFIDNLMWFQDESSYNMRRYRNFVDMFFENASFRKITNLGWGYDADKDIDKLMECIEGIEDYTNWKINIIFLVRDKEEIADSLAEKLPELFSKDDVDGFKRMTMNLVDVQKSRMLSARRIEDKVVDYSQLKSDPLSVLSLVNIYGYRPQSCLSEIINTKIK